MAVVGINFSAPLAPLLPETTDWTPQEIPLLPPLYSATVTIFDSLLAFEAQNNSFCVYNLNTQKTLYNCPGERDLFGLYEDGPYLISQSNGGPRSGADIKIWNKDSGQLVACLEGCVSFIISDNLIFGARFLGLKAYSIVVWNKLTGAVIHVLDNSEISHFLVADDSCFFAGMNDGTIKEWLKQDGSPLAGFQHETPTRVTAIATFSEYLISCHENGAIRMWNKKTHALSYECIFPEEKIRSLEIKEDILIAQSEKNLHLWNVVNQTHLYSIQNISCYVCDGHRLYTGSDAGIIEGRDVKTNARFCEFASFLGAPIFKLKLIGNHLFSIIQEKGVEMWDCNSYCLLKTFKAEGVAAISSHCVAISSLGKISLWILSPKS